MYFLSLKKQVYESGFVRNFAIQWPDNSLRLKELVNPFNPAVISIHGFDVDHGQSTWSG
jgi:hypothetical protein